MDNFVFPLVGGGVPMDNIVCPGVGWGGWGVGVFDAYFLSYFGTFTL